MRLLFLSAALLFALDASAQHNARYTPTGSTTETSISGTHGSSFALPQYGALGVLHELSFWQTGGRPCQVEADFWSAEGGFPATRLNGSRPTSSYLLTHVEHQDPGEPAPGVLLDCGTARQKQTVRAAFPTTTPPPGTLSSVTAWGHSGSAAIHGVRVCTGAGDAIRGVKVFVSTLNANGRGRISREPSLADEFERPGCRQWQQARRCPSGRVATGATAYYGANDTLVGLSLTCRSIQIDQGGGVLRRRN